MSDPEPLTVEQAVIIAGYTGILTGSFSDLHADVERRLGRGVQTAEFGMKSFKAELQDLYRADFVVISPYNPKGNV